MSKSNGLQCMHDVTIVGSDVTGTIDYRNRVLDAHFGGVSAEAGEEPG